MADLSVNFALQMMDNTAQATATSCAHCGEDCLEDSLVFDDKNFCCTGCKTVYEILSDNDLCDYYEIDSPNITVKTTEFGNKYAFLDNEEIENKLYHFADGDHRVLKLFIPSIHCASCIWLLENLARLSPGVISSQVNFVRKEVTLSFNRDQVSLRKLVELMASIGYPPDINLQGIKDNRNKKQSRTLLIKMGVAGFCFGNIMLMSFPEYLSFRFQDEAFYIQVFSWLNLALSLPIFFYSASDYFVSAWKGLRHKVINLDVPISLGIGVLFFRSTYDILTHTGPGYLDSLAGLVFFLLVGKWFQNKTYQALSFERDYKSYFPLAVTLIEKEEERSILANQLKKGDEIQLRNEELIPADSILISEEAQLDYSFVTGESNLVHKQKGDFVYAGGRLNGNAARVIVQEKVSQSYLTDLWNQQAFQKEDQHQFASLIDRVSQYFTIAIISIALLTAAFWFIVDSSLALETFTAVLIIACPCALALSLPFTMGNSIRIFGQEGLYVKNGQSIENLAKIDTVVFDKTGTLTTGKSSQVLFHGENRLSEKELAWIKAACRASTHPISQAIAKNINSDDPIKAEGWEEIPGAGIQCSFEGNAIKVGSAAFCESKEAIQGSHAFVSINGKLKGYFGIQNSQRQGLEKTLKDLKQSGMELHMLSGDTDINQEAISALFPNADQVHFKQSPQQKLDYIESLQKRGKKVLMLGDGLNDAGALKAALVGVAISEDVYSFSPACDAILDANQFSRLAQLMNFGKQSMKIVRWSFAFSFLYNLVGLLFAVQGLLTPIVAAILMPLSSISIVVFVTLNTRFFGRSILAKD